MSNNSQDYSQNLKETNLGGYKHLILPGESPVIALENTIIKVKKFIRSWHLDINVPRILLVLILSMSIVFLYINREQEEEQNQKNSYNVSKDISGLLIGGLGIWFAMSNLHSQYHYKKRSQASRYIEEWRNSQMTPLRNSVKGIFNEAFFDNHPTHFNCHLFNKCHSIITELKKTPDGVDILEETQSKILERLLKEENKEEKDNVTYILSFFEHMGQDVKCHVADSDYLKDYFYSIVINYYEFLRKYIEFVQYDRSRRVTYCNFVYMAQTWEKEGFLPELPIICKRPLVITSKDLKKAYDLQQVDKLNSTDKQEVAEELKHSNSLTLNLFVSLGSGYDGNEKAYQD